METQNYTCCKHNYTLFFFLRRLSIEKAGVYSKEQDKKKTKKKGNNTTDVNICFINYMIKTHMIKTN